MAGRKARMVPPVGAAHMAARYLLLLPGANLAREIARLPLHTLRREAAQPKLPGRSCTAPRATS